MISVLPFFVIPCFRDKCLPRTVSFASQQESSRNRISNQFSSVSVSSTALFSPSVFWVLFLDQQDEEGDEEGVEGLPVEVSRVDNDAIDFYLEEEGRGQEIMIICLPIVC